MLFISGGLDRSCDSHAYLSVKHGSVISTKSPSEAQRDSKYPPTEQTQETPIALAEYTEDLTAFSGTNKHTTTTIYDSSVYFLYNKV